MKFGYASGDEAIGYFVFREKKWDPGLGNNKKIKKLFLWG